MNFRCSETLGAAFAVAPDARDGDRDAEDQRRRADEAHDGALGAEVEALREEPRRGDHRGGAQCRGGDVERSLAREQLLAVEHADERRVHAVEEQHAADDAQADDDVRCADGAPYGAGEQKEADRDGRGAGGVDLQRLADGLRLLGVRGLRHATAHALDGRGDDGVIDDAADRQDAGERAVAAHAEHARQGDLRDQPLHHEVDLRERDREPTASGFARHLAITTVGCFRRARGSRGFFGGRVGVERHRARSAALRLLRRRFSRRILLVLDHSGPRYGTACRAPSTARALLAFSTLDAARITTSLPAPIPA